MKVVPCATTLCVINIKQTEAKVETLLSDYIQLQPATWSGDAQVRFCRSEPSISRRIHVALHGVSASLYAVLHQGWTAS